MRALLGLGIFLALVGGIFTYLARRSMALSPALARHPAGVWGFLAAFLLLMFLVPLANRLMDHHLDALYGLSYGLFGFVSSYLLFLAVADLGQFLLRRLAHAPAGIGSWAVGLAAGAALISCLAGLVPALRAPALKPVDVPIQGLPAGLDGFRMVQVSDLHLGPLVPAARVERLAERINGLAPDLVAVTGDLVDGEADGVRAKVERLAGLRSTHGVFFVTGNHEYYSGVAKWIPVIEGMGWQVLENTHRVIPHGGASLVVAGMPDPAARGRRGTGRGPDLAKALAGAPPEATKVLLFHPPTGYEAAAKAGVSLQLSGHTHAGQYFPWSLIVPLFYRFPRGLNRFGPMWIYTSVGTGFWGPPNRFLVSPELTLLVLRRA
ncbi:MAG TPA: metallophosphoesterase [Holophagaceae bacterium]